MTGTVCGALYFRTQTVKKERKNAKKLGQIR